MEIVQQIEPRKSTKFGWRGLLWWLIFLVTPIASVLPSVLVAPNLVVLSEAQRTGRVIVKNPTNTPKEIEIRLGFGLPESDSLGNVRVQLADSGVTDPRSAMEWIRAFPRKIVLPPQAEQVVRFVARPPSDLPEGEYWARIVVRSKDSRVDIPIDGEGEDISASVNMIVQTAISIKYRAGDCSVGVELAAATARQVDSTVVVMLDLKNRGNASYLGLLNCRLVDNRGREVSSRRLDLAVYRDQLRRMELPIPAGEFTEPFRVEVSISTEGRKDIPKEDLIPGNTVEKSILVGL
jgi:hypothetical protein